jgi:hypothetical protein
MNLPIKYDISKNMKLELNSKKISVTHDCVYKWNLKVIGYKGTDKSSYVAMIFLDNNNTEIIRRYRYITDYSGLEKEYQIISAVPYNAKNIILCYRINCEGAVPHHTIIDFYDLEQFTLLEHDKNTLESFDDVYDYVEHYKKYNLEENYWEIVGGGKNEAEYISNGEKKLNILKYFGFSN